MNYLDNVIDQLKELLDIVPEGNEKERTAILDFVREELLVSYKNGIETGRKTQKDGLRKPRPTFPRSAQ